METKSCPFIFDNCTRLRYSFDFGPEAFIHCHLLHMPVNSRVEPWLSDRFGYDAWIPNAVFIHFIDSFRRATFLLGLFFGNQRVSEMAKVTKSCSILISRLQCILHFLERANTSVYFSAGEDASVVTSRWQISVLCVELVVVHHLSHQYDSINLTGF